MGCFPIFLGAGVQPAAGPTASVGAAPSVLTSFALVSLDFTGSTDPAGGGLTYSCTLDVKPTSSATTLVDATTSTPGFTPDKIGTYSGVLTVTDINGRTDTSRWFREVRSALSVSIAAVSDQLDLSAATLDSTVTGGISPYTYAWTVDGATTGLSSSTAADPTFTPTGAGTPTGVVTVTDAAGQTAKASVTWRVGTTTGWVRVWKFIPADLADHDFLTTSTLVVDGVTVTLSGYETVPTVVGITGGVFTVDTGAGVGSAGIYITPVSVNAALADKEVCFIIGVDASLTSNDDGVYIAYYGTGAYASVEAWRTGGTQQLARERSGAAKTNRATTAGAQSRVHAIRMVAGRYAFQPLWSPTAWSGNGPAPDDLTVFGGPTSGWHTSYDSNAANTTEAFVPNTAGAGADVAAIGCRCANGRAYVIPGFTMWAKL